MPDRPVPARPVPARLRLTAPAQFRRPQGDAFGDSGPCGAVVIWTR